MNKNVRYDPTNYGIASNTGIDNYSSFMERSKAQIMMASKERAGNKSYNSMLKTQAAWNCFQDESVSSDLAFTEASNTHSELQLKSALKMNELLSCTSRRQSR